MKRVFILFCVLIGFNLGSAQVLISDLGPDSEPHPSAILDLQSDSKALILPRLAAAPAAPVDGMLYFDTTETCLKMYAGSQWLEIAGTCEAPYLVNVEFVSTSQTAQFADGSVTVGISYSNNGAPYDLSFTTSSNPYNLIVPGLTIPNGSGTIDYTMTWDTNPISYDDVTFDLNIIDLGIHTVGENSSMAITIEGEEIPAINLVQNPGFETGSTAGWATINSQVQNEEVFEGSWALRVNNTAQLKNTSQLVAGIEEGEYYTIRFMYKVDPTTTNVAPLRIFSTWRNASNSSLTSDNVRSSEYLQNSDNEWTEFSITAQAPATATQLFLQFQTAANALVFYDNFSVTRVPAPSN